jgi:hypothetical protein
MNEENRNERHVVTIDAMSLLDHDAIDDSLEDEVLSNFTLINMVKILRDPVDKFVVIAMIYGFQKNEIGFMLSIHPSTVTRMHQDIQRKLRRFQESTVEKVAGDPIEVNERTLIINFFKTVFPNDPAIRRLK